MRTLCGGEEATKRVMFGMIFTIMEQNLKNITFLWHNTKSLAF